MPSPLPPPPSSHQTHTYSLLLAILLYLDAFENHWAHVVPGYWNGFQITSLHRFETDDHVLIRFTWTYLAKIDNKKRILSSTIFTLIDGQLHWEWRKYTFRNAMRLDSFFLYFGMGRKLIVLCFVLTGFDAAANDTSKEYMLFFFIIRTHFFLIVKLLFLMVPTERCSSIFTQYGGSNKLQIAYFYLPMNYHNNKWFLFIIVCWSIIHNKKINTINIIRIHSFPAAAENKTVFHLSSIYRVCIVVV